MSIKLLELLAQHGGMIAVALAVPYVTLTIAVIRLYQSSLKDKERIIDLIQNKVEQDVKLEAAFISLKEVIRSQKGM